MNILTMNQNVFGSFFETTRRSSFTEKAINSELITPNSAIELNYEEMEYVEGGGRFKLTISSTLGGFVSGLSSGIVTGFITGYIMGRMTKIGTLMGGLIGSAVTMVLGGIAGWSISTVVNDMIYGRGGPSSVTLINIWIPFVNLNYDIDLGEEIGKLLGGFGGGIGGAALASSSGFALGFAV